MKTNIEIKIVAEPTMALCSELSEMQKAVWEMSDLDTIPPWRLFIAPKVGSHLIVAFEGEKPVAHGVFTHAVEKGKAQPYLYLDLVGVLAAYRNQKLGERIIEKSRELARNNGYASIQWTYDPLESANANLYIRKLGAQAVAYYPDYYGELSGKRHQGSASDRFLAVMGLQAKPYQHTPAQLVIELDSYEKYDAVMKATPQSLAIEVPLDMPLIVKSDPERGQEIRLATRRIFQDLLRRKYKIRGFHRDGGRNYYVAYGFLHPEV